MQFKVIVQAVQEADVSSNGDMHVKPNTMMTPYAVSTHRIAQTGNHKGSIEQFGGCMYLAEIISCETVIHCSGGRLNCMTQHSLFDDPGHRLNVREKACRVFLRSLDRRTFAAVKATVVHEGRANFHRVAGLCHHAHKPKRWPLDTNVQSAHKKHAGTHAQHSLGGGIV